MLPLDQLKLRDIESTFMSRRFMFALYSSEGRNVFKDFKVNCLKRQICNLSHCCRLWICHVRHRMMWTPGKLLSWGLEYIRRRAVLRLEVERERWDIFIILIIFGSWELQYSLLFLSLFKESVRNARFPCFFVQINKILHNGTSKQRRKIWSVKMCHLLFFFWGGVSLCLIILQIM